MMRTPLGLVLAFLVTLASASPLTAQTIPSLGEAPPQSAEPAVAAPALPAPEAPAAEAVAPRSKVVSLTAPTRESARDEAISLRSAAGGMPVRVPLNKTFQLPTLPVEARDVIVGNPDIADVIVRSPTQVFVIGRSLGQTNILFRDAQGRTIRRVEVDVHVDTEALKEVLAQVLPDEPGIKVSGIQDSIYLSGNVRSDRAAATARSIARRFVKDDTGIINLLKVTNEQQVLLKVKVAEIKKTALKEMGFSDTLTAASGLPPILKDALHTGPTTAAIGSGGLTGVMGSVVGTSTSALTATPYGALNLTGIGPFMSTLTMLESRSLVRTLEEPNLTAVSGETASMLAGGEFPVPVAAQNGQLAVAFKNYGIGLSFTPSVLDSGRISLKLLTEVSDIDKSLAVAVGGNLSVFGLKTRRAGSVVEMPSGGAIMIAGLLQNDISSAVAGIPALMDVPVLGRLFRSDSFQHNESELIVIVSAYIVQPTSPSQLGDATDGFVPSSDLNRFLFGRLQDIYVHPSPGAAASAQLQGPYGYVVQ